MPYCPSCRSEYRQGFEECATCGVPLVAEIPQGPVETTPEGARLYIEARKQVLVTQSTLDPCREVRDYLLEAGVPALVVAADEDDAMDQAAVHTRYNVVIAEDDVERAREALAGRQQDLMENEGLSGGDAAVQLEAGAQVTCPACGAVFVVNGEECPECGLFLGV